jgi:hypothetical protein
MRDQWELLNKQIRAMLRRGAYTGVGRSLCLCEDAEDDLGGRKTQVIHMPPVFRHNSG